MNLDEETILEEAKNIDVQKIVNTIRSNGLYNGLMYILLLNMSAYITKEIGMAPGGEFRVAYKEVSRHCIVYDVFTCHYGFLGFENSVLWCTLG